MNKYSSNIWKLALSVITNDSTFGIGVSVLFMLSLGLDLAQISVCLSFYLLFSTIGQVPSGIFADKYGYKTALAMGAIIFLFGTAGFAWAQNFGWLVAANSLLGFGSSMKQGADWALLYESLKKEGRQQEYKKMAGKIDFAANMFGVAASISGGILYAYNNRWPFWAEVVLVLAGLAAIISLKQPRISDKNKISVVEQLKSSFGYAFKTPKFSRLFIFSALIGSIALITIQYVQPLYKELGIKEVYFGLIGAVMFILRGAGSLFSDRLGRMLSVDKYLVLHAAVFGLFLVLIQKTGSVWLILLFIGIFFFLRGLYSPTISSFINDKVKSNIRATMLSINGQILTVATSLGLLATGWTAVNYDLNTTFFLISIISMSLLILYVIFLRKVQAE